MSEPPREPPFDWGAFTSAAAGLPPEAFQAMASATHHLGLAYEQLAQQLARELMMSGEAIIVVGETELSVSGVEEIQRRLSAAGVKVSVTRDGEAWELPATGGDVPGAADVLAELGRELRAAQAKQTRPVPDYLQHDPTKSHRRRRKRRR